MWEYLLCLQSSNQRLLNTELYSPFHSLHVHVKLALLFVFCSGEEAGSERTGNVLILTDSVRMSHDLNLGLFDPKIYNVTGLSMMLHVSKASCLQKVVHGYWQQNPCRG